MRRRCTNVPEHLWRNARAIYDASDGAATTRYYRLLESFGPVGIVAMNLFRAQKTSFRAKKYGPYAGDGNKSFRDLSYDRKAYSLRCLCQALTKHATSLTIKWGWGRDGTQSVNKWVLYVDLPTGQCSFHSPDRYDGPDYPGTWDGIRGVSEHRIIDWCEQVCTREVEERRTALRASLDAQSAQSHCSPPSPAPEAFPAPLEAEKTGP